MAPSDEALLRHVHQGDADAMAALVQRYHTRLYGFVFRYTQDRQISEDLVQETFLRVIRARDSTPDVFAPWLFRVALNLCRDHAKSAHNRREQPCAIAGDDTALSAPRARSDSASGDAADPLTLAEQRELRDAVEALPPLQREVLLLHYFADWTLVQIAGTLKLPLGTVKSRLFAGLAALRRAYRQPESDRETCAPRGAGLRGGHTVEQPRA